MTEPHYHITTTDKDFPESFLEHGPVRASVRAELFLRCGAKDVRIERCSREECIEDNA